MLCLCGILPCVSSKFGASDDFLCNGFMAVPAGVGDLVRPLSPLHEETSFMDDDSQIHPAVNRCPVISMIVDRY